MLKYQGTIQKGKETEPSYRTTFDQDLLFSSEETLSLEGLALC